MAMKVQLLAENGQSRAWYLISGARLSFLNALRRALIADLPAFAMDEISFYENTSAMFNEYMANRLGLVPLKYEETSANSTVSFSLDAEALDEEKTVYSGDLVSQDEVIVPAFMHIPLMKLGKGQRLRLEATATVGTAKTHAKFQSAIGSFGKVAEFKLTDKCKKCARAMKPAEPELMGKIPNASLPEHSVLCEACETKVSPPEKDDVLFLVESYNNIPARQQFSRAIKILEERYKTLGEFVKTA
ncbi:DNA-directed RNA polymerase subunit D [Candidatus Micrarchaeota archaeon]|nr:DNA-directed RNA polymerase subunit D [Candidatus Micrarchaeota archaeon]